MAKISVNTVSKQMINDQIPSLDNVVFLPTLIIKVKRKSQKAKMVFDARAIGERVINVRTERYENSIRDFWRAC